MCQVLNQNELAGHLDRDVNDEGLPVTLHLVEVKNAQEAFEERDRAREVQLEVQRSDYRLFEVVEFLLGDCDVPLLGDCLLYTSPSPRD